MTALLRPPAAVDQIIAAGPVRAPEPGLASWQQAEPIRREWLAVGLATEPADRPAVEAILTRLYARHRRPRPTFSWVDSPRAAAPHLAGQPSHEDLQRWVRGRQPSGTRPIASDLAAGLSRLRSALDACLTPPSFDRPPPKRGKPYEPWPVLPVPEALRLGIPFREIVRQGVLDALRTSLAAGFHHPVRAALATGKPTPISWYGQQDAPWIAYYDTYRRLGLAHYPRADEEQFDEWATLARCGGWWWPGEECCVLAERPAVVRVEPVARALHEEVRPTAIEYRDGWRPLR